MIEERSDATRGQVLAAIGELVAALGWRIRDQDQWQVVLLPPLARSRPERNRWPHEPEEREERQHHGA